MKIENMKYNNFQDFACSVLIPTGEMSKQLGGFVFRGESSNKFELLPTSLRPGNKERLWGENKPIDNQSECEFWQIHAEYMLLREFYKSANDNGLKIPKVGSIIKNYIDEFPSERMFRREPYKWISDEISELAALAQHYGVLTRLLDWTFDIDVALYFSCTGAIKARLNSIFSEDDTIVVWALNAQHIQFLQHSTARIPLNFVIPAYFDNPNINAQKGLLSYWEIEMPGLFEQSKEMMEGVNPRLVDRTPINELLQQHCTSEIDEHIVLLYKFEFPIHDCISAYEFIRKLGYNAARIFPGYNGVVKDMDELSLLQRIIKLEK